MLPVCHPCSELLLWSECVCLLRIHTSYSVMVKLGRQLEQIKNKQEEVGEMVQWVKCLLCKWALEFGSLAPAKAEWAQWAPVIPMQWEIEAGNHHAGSTNNWLNQ